MSSTFLVLVLMTSPPDLRTRPAARGARRAPSARGQPGGSPTACTLRPPARGSARSDPAGPRCSPAPRSQWSTGDAGAGNRAQLLLDGLECLSRPPCTRSAGQRESDREDRREPAHGPRQVDIVEDRLPAVPFEVHQQAPVSGPSLERLEQGREKDV